MSGQEMGPPGPSSLAALASEQSDIELAPRVQLSGSFVANQVLDKVETFRRSYRDPRSRTYPSGTDPL